MEKQKRNARRDGISIANKIDNARLTVNVHEQDRSSTVLEHAGQKRNSEGKISILMWKAPTNGIAGLL